MSNAGGGIAAEDSARKRKHRNHRWHFCRGPRLMEALAFELALCAI